MSFILPCTKKDSNLAELCVYSIIKLFKNEDIDKFLIITSQEDYNFFKNLFDKYPIVEIINEEILIKNNLEGWKKQQIFILLISNNINTEYYISLDSDCYLTKKISINDLIFNDKPLVNLMHKHKNSWLIKSSEYFKIKYNDIPDPIMNVTPNIFKTSITRELIKKHNVTNLINKGCNEYYLYFCYLLKNYKFEEIYTLINNLCLEHCCVEKNNNLEIRKQFGGNGIWVEKNIIEGDLEKTINSQFRNKNILFSLFQSNIKLKHNNHIEIIRNNINNIL